MDALVGGIAGVDEVDDDDIVLLAVAVAASDSLFDSLRVPREVEVDEEGAELHVDSLGSGLGGDEDGSVVAEVIDESGADVDGTRAGGFTIVGIRDEPLFVDGFAFRGIVGAVKDNDFSSVAILF